MILLLAFLIQTEVPRNECQIFYYTRIRWVESNSHWGTPSVFVNREAITGLRPDRAEVEAERDRIIREGFELPRIMEDWSEERIAPGAFLSVSVRRACCHVPPIPDGWCIFPEGE